MTHYRTTTEAELVTIATDSDTGEDVLVHVACAKANPTTITPWGGDYTYEDGECCAVCGNDLAHAGGYLDRGEPIKPTKGNYIHDSHAVENVGNRVARKYLTTPG